ncbi:phage tail protein [Dankookia sp. P2]|uniref:phage tail protein n=1 Tax=Dankookia sp. P2 TaxID=3423955 RepID=UPI003D673928
MQADRIARLLPEIYRGAAQQGSILDAILHVMEALHAPAEARLATLDAVFDPRRAEDAFVAMLAAWLALDPMLQSQAQADPEWRGRLAITPGNLRELVAEAWGLAQARGTPRSLARFLELATGLPGFEVTSPPPGADGTVPPFAARLLAPQAARAMAPLVERIVAFEKPAFTEVQIMFRDA